jgi:hypothetical protein
MRKLSILCLTISVLSFETFAQSRKYSNEFLSLGVGSRAFGMSNSVVASTGDVHSGYWNPAGLTQMTGNLQVGLMHAEYFGDIAKYDYGAIAYKIDNKSNFAFSVIRFGVDDIPNTTELIDAGGNINYDRISSFSAIDYAFLASYARKMKDERLSIGANVKVIERSVGDFAQAWGFGLDLGLQYKLEHFSFAAMARDISTTFNTWSYNLDDATKDAFIRTGNEIPENSIEITNPKLILGAAYQTKISSKFGLLAEINTDISSDGQRNVLISADPFSIDPHVGLELDYRKIAYLRTGIGNIQKIKDFDGSESTTIQPNFGVGVKIKNVSIDYALTNIGNLSDALYSNIFSLRIDFSPRN